MRDWLLFVQVIAGACLFVSTFCRLTKTDMNTIREVRWSIWFMAVAAMMVVGAPFMPIFDPRTPWEAGVTPYWVWLALLLAIVAVQIVSSRHWKHGTPPAFKLEA